MDPVALIASAVDQTLLSDLLTRFCTGDVDAAQAKL